MGGKDSASCLLFVPAQQCRRASPAFPPLCGQRSFSSPPDGREFLNTDDIFQTQFGEPFSKLAIIAIGGIGQHESRCDFFLHRFSNLLKRNAGLVAKVTSRGMPVVLRRLRS